MISSKNPDLSELGKEKIRKYLKSIADQILQLRKRYPGYAYILDDLYIEVKKLLRFKPRN